MKINCQKKYKKRNEEIILLRVKEKLTLKEIGDKFDITRERIRQIISQFIKNSENKELIKELRGVDKRIKPKTKKNCKRCGKEFETTPSMKDKKFCSDECFRKYSKAHAYVTRECKCCGKEFEVRRAYVERGQGKFCSRKCLGKFIGKNYGFGSNKNK